MPLDITLATLFQDHKTDLIERLAGPILGQIKSFDPLTGLADVAPLQSLPVQFDGEVTYETLPTFGGVPVGFLRAGGGVITFPVAADDYCVLIFAAVATGETRLTGQASDPKDCTRLGWGYPIVALPITCGIVVDPLSPVDAVERAAGMVIGKEGHNGIAVFTDDVVALGKGALLTGKPVALAGAPLNTLLDAMSVFFGAVGTATSVDSSVIDSALTAAKTAMAATLVKAK